jgi:tRNA(Arg) A34 adenosine deaminase TadA
MDLDPAWSRALSGAWHSFLAGTTPVGAVVTGPSGEIVAEGRGRRYEPRSDGPQLTHSHIAHAEVNALALLPPDRHYEDHALLTTLEPCCMCLGATVQATVTRLCYAGRDPYGGAAGLIIDTPQARSRPLRVEGPLPGRPGRFAELLHVRQLAEAGSVKVLAEQQRGLPDIYAAATSVAADDLFGELRTAGASLADAMTATRALLPTPDFTSGK